MTERDLDAVDLDACAIPTAEQIEQMERGFGAIYTPRMALELGMRTAIGNVKRALALGEKARTVTEGETDFRQLTPQQKLIEAIKHEMALGFRHFMIRGAELDTVLEALSAYGENGREEK